MVGKTISHYQILEKLGEDDAAYIRFCKEPQPR